MNAQAFGLTLYRCGAPSSVPRRRRATPRCSSAKSSGACSSGSITSAAGHRVLDSADGVGHGLKLLRRRYPGRIFWGVDFAPALSEAKREESLFERAWRLVSGSGRFHLCADFAGSRFPSAWIWCGRILRLPGRRSARCAARGSPRAHRRRAADVLELRARHAEELKASLRRGLGSAPCAFFIDMHDLGDDARRERICRATGHDME